MKFKLVLFCRLPLPIAPSSYHFDLYLQLYSNTICKSACGDTLDLGPVRQCVDHNATNEPIGAIPCCDLSPLFFWSSELSTLLLYEFIQTQLTCTHGLVNYEFLRGLSRPYECVTRPSLGYPDTESCL